MKLVLLLAFCALAAAAPAAKDENAIGTPQERSSLLINALLRQALSYLRFVIKNGSYIFGTQPLDPLKIDSTHLYLPAGLVNLDLHLKNVLATGLGDFVVNRSHMNVVAKTIELDITIPRLNITSEEYDFLGDLFGAIPLYGKGYARFEVESFKLRGVIHFSQSEDGESVVIDDIVEASFEMPIFRSYLTGVIGGGDIDKVVNAVIEDVIISYVNRFHNVLVSSFTKLLVIYGNPILEQLNTWKYVDPFIPSA